ncbi:hypothetical protein B0H13DRAFT_1853666 [Mycena leptocephala]|nr:hypothetical protein B0H13DRAFT_1853666 [Mycena leptocephala]
MQAGGPHGSVVPFQTEIIEVLNIQVRRIQVGYWDERTKQGDKHNHAPGAADDDEIGSAVIAAVRVVDAESNEGEVFHGKYKAVVQVPCADRNYPVHAQTYIGLLTGRDNTSQVYAKRLDRLAVHSNGAAGGAGCEPLVYLTFCQRHDFSVNLVCCTRQPLMSHGPLRKIFRILVPFRFGLRCWDFCPSFSIKKLATKGKEPTEISGESTAQELGKRRRKPTTRLKRGVTIFEAQKFLGVHPVAHVLASPGFHRVLALPLATCALTV